MKSFLFILTTIMMFSLFACGQKKNDKTFQVFNEGVTLNLDAIDEQNKGNFKKAASLNKKSIEKFKETLKLDSTHPVVRTTLAHGLYVDGQFKEAIFWFDQANKLNGETAANYRGLGLCNINLGQIKDGKAALDKAFSMDPTKEIREITVQDLVNVGQLAIEYGDGYIRQGEPDKGKAYKEFSIGVLMLAFKYDKSRKDVASAIADLASMLGETEISKKYKSFVKL